MSSGANKFKTRGGNAGMEWRRKKWTTMQSVNYVQKTGFREKRKTQRSYAPLCGYTIFVQPTPALTLTIIDKITIYFNGVNKTRPSLQLLA